MPKYPTILNRTSQKLKAGFDFAVIISLLKTRRYQTIIVISGLIYAFAYMFILGIISYYQGLSSATATFPVVRTLSYGISIVPAPDIYIFVFYQTIAFIIISSFLVGLNIALMFYSRKSGTSCGIRSLNTKGIFGIIPAFFTSFACCGGGLLALVIGPTVFSSLSLYSKYMAPLAIAVLAIGTILMSMNISESYRIRDSISDRCERNIRKQELGGQI